MKMPDRLEPRYFAPCGIDCTVCYVHLKAKKPCPGCLVSDENKPERCQRCAIKACAVKKGLVLCLECGDFPCARINNLDKSYRTRYATSLIGNSRQVREHGIEWFMETEVAAWRCDCGGVVSLHDGFCSECGKVRQKAIP